MAGLWSAIIKLFDYVSLDPQMMFEQKPISDLVRDKQLNSYQHKDFWQSMDNYQEMQYLQPSLGQR